MKQKNDINHFSVTEKEEFRKSLYMRQGKLLLLFLLFFFLSFSSNLQAQISVNPASLCAGTSPAVSISIGITGGVSPYTVSYRIGAGAPIIKTNYIKGTPINLTTPLANTTYTIVSVTDKNGNTIPIIGSATVTVLPRPALPIIDADGPTTFCAGGSVVLKPRVSATTYRWTTPQGILTTETIMVSTAGNYSLQVTNANGCSSINSIAKTIFVNPLPLTPIIESIIQPTCLKNTGTVVLSGLPATGTWTLNPGETEEITGSGVTITLSDLSIGTHHYTVRNESGCTSLPTTDIILNLESSLPDVPVLNTQMNSCQSSFTQTWEAVTAATGYRLDVATDPDFTTFLADYQDKELSNTTSETVIGVIPGKNYYVRLRTITNCGVSPNSNTITASPVTTIYNNGTWSNGFPDSTKSVVFDSDYNITSNMEACSCQVNTGKNVVVNSNIVLKLEYGLTVDGTLTFENNSSLVQVNEAVNTGAIFYKRITSPMKDFDFTFWSSPVKGQTLFNLSPNTLGDKYYRLDNESWTILYNGNAVMEPGTGYLIRTPKSGTWPNGEVVAFPYSQPVTFIGVPNNGHLEYTPAVNKSNMIGNPYPSALDADLFLEANENVLNGSLYFWTHNTAVGSIEQYQYSNDDYACYNALGGIATAAPSDSTGGTNSSKPSGKIAAGQSFMIQSLNVANQNVIFKNSMRVMGQNTQFFKPGKNAKTDSVEKDRFWLNLTNTEGAFKQILVGYISGATNGHDNRFDGENWSSDAFVNFYSINSGADLSIQGRAVPFDNTDTVVLGYKSTIEGTFSISIDEANGLFINHSIYIEDKLTSTYHDLKCGAYTFTTLIGTFNNRFVIHYNNTTNRPIVNAPIASNYVIGCNQTSYVQQWTAVNNIKGYKIDVATDANFTEFLTGYQDKELTAVTSDSITGIIPGKPYYVRLRAFNDCGTSANSNTVTISPVTTTYENGVWSNGFPDSSKRIVFSSSYSITSNMNGCSCTINTGANVTVNSDIVLQLENGLTVEGTLTFENNSSLLQINEAVNTGAIIYKRYSSPMQDFDWTAWASPVTGYTLFQVSPNTIADKYMYYDGGWQISYNGTAVMQPGIGYQVRTPKANSWPNGEVVSFPYSQLVKFTGVPNNGTIIGANFIPKRSNLVGNPYPSAIDVEIFLNENPGLYGTIRIPNHNTPITNLQYSPNDFSVFNFLGGIAGGEPGQGVTSSKPTGKIAVGQSFFVSSWDTGAMKFNNGMRVIGQNSQFFKPGKTKKDAAIEKHRFWLNLTNTAGGFRQILIGYATGATNDYNSRFDYNISAITSHIIFYSINQYNYSIQARALPFDDTDIVPLGYNATISGTHTIAIDEVDGLFVDQPIYLEDKTTNTYHNLKESNYSFNTAVGTFNNRFVIHYITNAGTGKKLNIKENLNQTNDPLVAVNNSEISVYGFTEKIIKVNIFDTKGSLIYEEDNLNTSNVVIDKLPVKSQVLIVKTTLQNGKTSSAKIIF